MSASTHAKIVPPGKGAWLNWLGVPVELLVEGAESDGAYALSHGFVPVGHGPPPHRHEFEESFYVLNGELTFDVGAEQVVLGPHGFIHIGGGAAHALRNEGDAPAEVLVVVGPAGLDAYQRAVGSPLAGPTDEPLPYSDADHARARELAPQYGIELDPPAAAFAQPPRIIVRREGEGPIIAIVGDRYTFQVVGGDTRGRYALWDALVPPGSGPPIHLHRREFEAFFVLEGEITFYADDVRATLGPGGCVQLPPHRGHRFCNESNQPARTLILAGPAGFENFFFETGVRLADHSVPVPPPNPAEIERLLAAASKYEVEFVK